MNRARIFGGASVVAALLSGCTASLNTGWPTLSAPGCLRPYHVRPDNLDGSLVLSAQSVPSASLVPCLRRLPAGWSVHNFQAQQGHSQISLVLGMPNTNTVTVALAAACDIGDARPTPTDEPGTRRFDKRDADAPGYRGTRIYTFPGGCATYRFDFAAGASQMLATAVDSGVGFMSRAVLVRYVRDHEDQALCGRGAVCPR